jgi:hypothetical protein
MKVVIGIVVLIAIGAAVVYFGGELFRFDPNKQAQDAMASITPGMTWQQVIDTVGDPQKVQVFIEREEMIGGEKTTVIKPGQPFDYNKSRHVNRIDNGEMPHGYIFVYWYSNASAFDVTFDPDGTVTYVSEKMTPNSLLNR